jgi:uncharacterized membrane protein
MLLDWAPNLHPLFVHFPIALWVAGVVVDVLALTFPRAVWADVVASFMYPAGATSAVLAYLTGRRAATSVLIPGMANPLVQEHWNWALATTLAFAVVAVCRLWVRFRSPKPRRVLHAAVVVAALLALGSLVQTGDRGARLVFEHGVGVAVPGAAR